ncbi:MAG TPA: STAS domain-containing protein [Pyrinomonadaceae bacterium]|jgi:anti-sigma B factor antagonist
MKNLTFTERRTGDVIILDLEGNIRLGEGSMEFRQLIRRLVQDKEKNILLNLARISYIDSSGLGEVVAGYTSLQKIDAKMKLLHLTRRVNELMMITKLLTIFEVYDDEAEALKSFQPAAGNAEIRQSSVVTGKLDEALINF